MTTIAVHGKSSPEEDAIRQFIVDAALVARVFDMSEVRVWALMQRKLFKSVVEKGVDEDEGSWRLTCGAAIGPGREF